MALPDVVRLDAWIDRRTTVAGELADTAADWSMGATFPPAAGTLAPEEERHMSQWSDKQHGWGIVLPMPAEDGWSAAELALAKDQPQPVQQLVTHRLPAEVGPAPVFRYDPTLPAFLRRHFPDGGTAEPLYGVEIGLLGTNEVPRYLLIIASPADVPWRLQYALNQNHLVGRLDLDEEGLGNYAEALLSGWADAAADPQLATVWSVDLGADDITREMRATIAHPVFERLQSDTEIGAGTEGLSDADATVAALRRSLDRHPGLIVTTSHGRTSPLDAADELAATLGVLVDHNDAFVDPAALADWSPDGAIWYAHACCSAGGDHHSSYRGLLAAGSVAQRVVDGVAQLPPQVAPLPRALLGAPRPLRAFVGQVEPTFDWTLRDELNQQPLTDGIARGLYTNLFQPTPIGLAFDAYHRGVGQLYRRWAKLRDEVNAAVDVDDVVLHDAARVRLTAIDRESLVILGDPTVAPRPLPSRVR